MNRNRDLFWKLTESEHLRARAFCRKLMQNREDGDDLYQDGLVTAFAKFQSLRDTEAFRPWLYQILVNTFKNRKRRSWWARFSPLTDRIAESARSEDPGRRHAARRRLEIAFRALSAEDRALVTLFELEGWTVAELAGMKGRSRGAVKVRLSRARQKMRMALARDFQNQKSDPILRSIVGEDNVCVAMRPSED